MNSLLYYPYINLPQNDWTIRALLYYDNVNTIAPMDSTDNGDIGTSDKNGTLRTLAVGNRGLGIEY